MYEIIQQIINHSWLDNAPEQSYIYYICCCIIPLFFVWLLGEVTSLICFFRRK